MKEFVVPVEATITYEYVVKADDISDVIDKIDNYINIKTDLVDKDVEAIELRNGYDEVIYDPDKIRENNGEYDTKVLRSQEPFIYLGN